MENQLDKKFLEFSHDFLPSLIQVIFSIYFWKIREQTECSIMYESFYLLFTLLNLLFIARGVGRLLLKESIFIRKVWNISDLFMYLIFYLLIISGWMIFRSNSCFYTDLDNTSFIFITIFLGIICLSRHILSIVFLVLAFGLILSMFFNNPTNFYNRIGVDPKIIDNLPTFTAIKRHCSLSCIVCTETFALDDKLIQLKCPGRHVFHSECIKSWLKRKFSCPLCRSSNIL